MLSKKKLNHSLEAESEILDCDRPFEWANLTENIRKKRTSEDMNFTKASWQTLNSINRKRKLSDVSKGFQPTFTIDTILQRLPDKR